MDTTVHIHMSFMASVFDLRDRACRQLRCGAGSRYELWKYTRPLRKKERLCGSAMDAAQAAEGDLTLWCGSRSSCYAQCPPTHTHYCPSANHCMSCGDDRNAGVRDNDTLCLVRYEPMPAKEVQQPLLERTTSSQAMRRFRSSDDDMALTLG
jgi:hypothetical protein